jgi:hypothetical protein
METKDFKNWFISKYSWMNVSENDIEILETTEHLVMCKKYGYRYCVYELIDGNFQERIDCKNETEANKEFERRKDTTASMPLSEKVAMIEDDSIKEFVKSSIAGFKGYLVSCHKILAIDASVKLGLLANMTLTELINAAKTAMITSK